MEGRSSDTAETKTPSIRYRRRRGGVSVPAAATPDWLTAGEGSDALAATSPPMTKSETSVKMGPQRRHTLEIYVRI